MINNELISINDFLALGIELKRKSGNEKTKCPKCKTTRKNKNDNPLSVNIDKGLYNCHNCGWSGNVKLKQKKSYFLPVEQKSELSDRTISWFNKRGITEATLVHWKIGESVEYFPQVDKRRKAINFNYYKENKLINVIDQSEVNKKILLKIENECQVYDFPVDELSKFEINN